MASSSQTGGNIVGEDIGVVQVKSPPSVLLDFLENKICTQNVLSANQEKLVDQSGRYEVDKYNISGLTKRCLSLSSICDIPEPPHKHPKTNILPSNLLSKVTNFVKEKNNENHITDIIDENVNSILFPSSDTPHLQTTPVEISIPCKSEVELLTSLGDRVVTSTVVDSSTQYKRRRKQSRRKKKTRSVFAPSLSVPDSLDLLCLHGDNKFYNNQVVSHRHRQDTECSCVECNNNSVDQMEWDPCYDVEAQKEQGVLEEFLDLDLSTSMDSVDDPSRGSVFNVSALFSDAFDRSYKMYQRKEKKRSRSKKITDYHPLYKEIGDCMHAQRRPNYFVAVQIKNEKIQNRILCVQHHMVKEQPALSAAVVKPATLHLTLLVMHLTEEQLPIAFTALDRCKDIILGTAKSQEVENQEEHGSHMNIDPESGELHESSLCISNSDSNERTSSSSKESSIDNCHSLLPPIQLSLSKIGSFRDEVVFAQVDPGRDLDRLREVADIVSQCFKDRGFSSGDGKGFKAHATFMKLSKAPKLRKKGIKKISPHLYSSYKQHRFGKQTVLNLQLCSMLKPKDPSGYYHVDYAVPLVPTEHDDNFPDDDDDDNIGADWSDSGASSPISHMGEQLVNQALREALLQLSSRSDSQAISGLRDGLHSVEILEKKINWKFTQPFAQI